MDIRGGYAKPKWTDVLWVQLFLLPITTCKWAYFYGRWLWKFGLCRQEYGEEEKLYVIRRNMGLSQLQFNVSGCNEMTLNSCSISRASVLSQGQAGIFKCCPRWTDKSLTITLKL